MYMYMYMASKETDYYVAERPIHLAFITYSSCYNAYGSRFKYFQRSFRVLVFDKKYHKNSKLKQDKKKNKAVRLKISSFSFCGDPDKQFWVPVLDWMYQARKQKVEVDINKSCEGEALRRKRAFAEFLL